MGKIRKPADFYFREHHQARNIGRKSVRAYLFTAGANGLKFFINIATVSILARLLVPEDFGYVAMAAAFVSTPKIVAGQHLAMGVVQARTISVRQLNTFFWLSATITLAIAAAAWLGSPLVAWFFDEPRLTGITRVMSTMVLFAGLSAVHRSLLARTMQFGVISGIDLAARIISKITAVVLAVTGMGYWALVFMPVSYESARMALLWMFCSFTPGFGGADGDSSEGGRSLIRIGSVWSGNSVLTSLVSELDRIVIGKFLSSQALGFYSRAFSLGEMPGKFIAWPLAGISISALSRLQDNREKYRRFFFILTEGYLFAFVPVLMLLFLSSENIVLLVLGEKWRDAVPIFRGLIPFFLMKNMSRPVRWFLASTCDTQRLLRKITVKSVINNTAFAIGVFAGLYWGITGVVVSLALSSLVSFFISVFYVFHGEIITPGAFMRVVWRPLFACGATLFLSSLVPFEAWLGTSGHLVLILARSLLGILVYMACVLMLPGGKKRLVDVMMSVREILKTKKQGR
ncbi:MAG: lipopolysaccharide biosynthesis protein [Desulfobacter sp.]